MNTNDYPESLLEVWRKYALEIQASLPEKRACAKLTHLKTALIRYTLPSWGLPISQGNRVTEFETEQAFDLMARISLEQLQSALLVQHQVFEQQQVPDKIRRTYRSVLKQFLTWCHQQEWFLACSNTEQQLLVPPKRHKRSAQALHVRKKHASENGQPAQAYRYSLGAVKGDFIPKRLQEELDAFIEFRKNSSLPRFQSIRASTLDRELAGIYLILGWLHRVQGIQSKDLSLTQIVPLVALEVVDEQTAYQRAEAAVEKSVALAYKYIDWLRTEPEQGGRGLETQQVELSNLRIFKSVARFMCHRQTSADRSFQFEWRVEKLIVEAFSQGINTWYTRGSKEIELNNTLLVETISTWPEVLAFVERLRAECVPRLKIERQTRKQKVSFGPLRSLSAIAQSYQRFLLCALMSYLPPHRQQVYRNLLIGQNHSSNLEEVNGYLYKKDDIWYAVIFDGRHRLNIAQRVHHFEIPNIHYADGCYFYQYIQDWLCEYTYLDTEGQERRINGLRLVLQPQHSYLFTKKNGEKYANPTELSRLVRDAAFKLTGKTINTHRFRNLFVTYFMQKEPDAEVLRAFANLMGHSTEMTLTTYAKAIEEPEIAKLVGRSTENIAQALVDVIR